MLLIIGLVFFGFGVAGAISGFIFASIFGFALGFALTGFSFGSRGFPYSKLLNFMVPVVCFAVVTNVLLNFDLLAVKALSPQMVSDSLAGFYTAAGTISKIPYGLVGSLIIVLFPLVSGTFNANRKEKSSFYLSSAMRYSMLILLPLTIMISVSPAEIISFIYGDEFANGAAPLSILSFALFFLALFVVLSTAISASDKPKVSLAIGLAAVAIDVALNIALVPLFSMNGAAFSTLIASLFAFLVAFAYAELRFRSVLGIPAFVKILFASLIIGAMSHFFPSSGLLLVLKYCLLLVFYIAVLFALKGISKTDWAILHNVIR
jgi:O-antigen/teichoic acid export membrane protein